MPRLRRFFFLCFFFFLLSLPLLLAEMRSKDEMPFRCDTLAVDGFRNENVPSFNYQASESERRRKKWRSTTNFQQVFSLLTESVHHCLDVFVTCIFFPSKYNLSNCRRALVFRTLIWNLKQFTNEALHVNGHR